MVNGTLSRILYISAALLVALSTAGSVLLSALGRPANDDLRYLTAACLAFLFGAHIKPPVTAQNAANAATGGKLETTETPAAEGAASGQG